MKRMTINTCVSILGAMWIVRSETEKDEPRLVGKNGFTDWTARTICLEKEWTGDLDSAEEFMRKVIRHEVIHAFMFESGLGECFEHCDYGQEETLIDWIAFQLPKINPVLYEIYASTAWEDSE